MAGEGESRVKTEPGARTEQENRGGPEQKPEPALPRPPPEKANRSSDYRFVEPVRDLRRTDGSVNLAEPGSRLSAVHHNFAEPRGLLVVPPPVFVRICLFESASTLAASKGLPRRSKELC